MIRDPKNSDPLPTDERRATRRFATNRPARFSDAAGEGPLRSGRVVEMSPTGLRIVTATAPTPGQAIEIEIESEHGGDPNLLRGDVVRAEPIDRGKFAVGVASRFEIHGELRSVTRADIASENIRAATPHTIPDPIHFVPRSARRKKTIRRRLLIAATMALVLLSLLPTGVPREDSMIAAIGNGAVYTAERPLNDHAKQRVYTERVVRGDRDPLALSPAVPNEPGELSHVIASTPQAPMARFVSTIERVDATAARGDRVEAEALVQSTSILTADLHPVWSERISAYSRWSEGGVGAATRVEPMDMEIELAQATPDFADEPLLIEVDAINYVLHVRRNDAIVRSFPVGLGRDGATPLGRFVVTDKITNPDWYDRGRSVPAGSPDNPLGARWMGLAQGGHGNGIGMHPSADDASIEQPWSRGCVRLTPADAEALFRLAPPGTPVWIHE